MFDLNSPPLVGCSILITSALNKTQYNFLTSPTSNVGPYWVARRVPKISQYLSTIWLLSKSVTAMPPARVSLTPASTLVISSTLMPANGRLVASPLAAGVVAMPLLAMRQWHCESNLGAVSQRLELLSITFIISRICGCRFQEVLLCCRRSSPRSTSVPISSNSEVRG